MRRIDRAFEDLRPVARNDRLGDRYPNIGRGRERRRLERRHAVARPHVTPHPAAPFLDRIGTVFHLLLERTGGGLGRHLQHIAFDVHLPAVIQAAQAGLLVASQHQRDTPVRTILVQHADAAVAVAKHHQVLAQDARLDRRAVRFRHLLAQRHRDPVPAHQLAHRGRAFDPAQQVVFVFGQHGVLTFPAHAWRQLLAKSLVG